MPNNNERTNQALQEFHAYLETLTFIQVDPRLRCKFGLSDIIQRTLLEASRDWERIRELDAASRKRWLRRMFMNNLLDEIEHWRGAAHDYQREQPLEEAAAESECRLRESLAIEDSSPIDKLIREEDRLQLLEALSKLAPRQREALTLQKYHGWTLAQIAEHLGCTPNAVAGLHARGLKELRKHLSQMK
ncbi:MAG TPA: sigma-70 family RNA polymerase sigma factor [Gemmataceae bacterium]|nr:sigma-70 family RNA polymerase sigma factor [Gemmataceae bacterium]